MVHSAGKYEHRVTGHVSGMSTEARKQKSRYEVRGPDDGAVFTPAGLPAGEVTSNLL